MTARKPPAKPTRPRRDFAAEEASRTRAQVKLWLAVDGLVDGGVYRRVLRAA